MYCVFNNCLFKQISTNKNTRMKKDYKIEVDCANCAAKMEQASKEVKGVKDIVINFIMQRLTVEFEEGTDTETVMEDVVKVCRRVEPDCEIAC